jgi:hypothetical protein
MVKIPVGWRVSSSNQQAVLTACAVIVRFDFTESRGWESLLYIRILQVSSLVVVAGFAELSSHTLIIHGAQPRQHQHEVRHYDVERGARRHHGASIERYPASPSNTKNREILGAKMSFGLVRTW